MELQTIWTGSGFRPHTQADLEKCDRYRIGDVCTMKATRDRNPRFHRRYFALLNLGFDYWEPPAIEHGGLTAVKNFERFRKDVLIKCGHYELVVNIKGEARAEAKSISFSNLDELEFQGLYSKTIDVLMDLVFRQKGMTRVQVDNAIEQILQFN